MVKHSAVEPDFPQLPKAVFESVLRSCQVDGVEELADVPRFVLWNRVIGGMNRLRSEERSLVESRHEFLRGGPAADKVGVILRRIARVRGVLAVEDHASMLPRLRFA